MAQINNGEGNPFLAMFGSGMSMFFAIGLYIAMAIALMTIAQKTNTPNGWFAWVPILNIVLMVQIAELELWWIILCFIPCLNLFAFIYIWWKIAERRNKPGALAIAMIIPVLNFIIPLYIAFSDDVSS